MLTLSYLQASERKGRVKGGQREQGLKKKRVGGWGNYGTTWHINGRSGARDYCRDAQKVADKTTSSIKLREAAVACVSLGVRL